MTFALHIAQTRLQGIHEAFKESFVDRHEKNITPCNFGRKLAGARSYGPETIYMFGDLEEGTYAVMAYVVSSTGLDKFEGCEAISMFSG